MELLTHGGEHHEIGDGGWLMMTAATNPPLRSPERTPDQPPPLPRWPPRDPSTPTPTPYIGFRGEKNQREGFIAFYDTEPSPSPNLSREG